MKKMLANMIVNVLTVLLLTVLVAANAVDDVVGKSPVSPLAAQFGEDLKVVADHEDMLGASALPALDKRIEQRACWRNMFARTSRVPTKSHPCEDGKEVKESGICYSICPDSYEGLGPICWSQCRCKLAYKTLFFCCDDKDVCTTLISQVVTKLPLEIAQFLVDLTSQQLDAQKIIKDFKILLESVVDLLLPTCDKEIPTGCSHGMPKLVADQPTEAMKEL